MTPDDICKLKPDRDTDAMVGKVLGHIVEWLTSYDGSPQPVIKGTNVLVEFYTADTPDGWAASRECWEWLRSRGWLPIIDPGVAPGRIYVVASHEEHVNMVAIGEHLPHALAILAPLVAQAEVCCEAARQQ